MSCYQSKQETTLKPSIFDKTPKNKRVRFVERIEQRSVDEDKEHMGFPALAHLRCTRRAPSPPRAIDPRIPAAIALVNTMFRLLGLFLIYHLYRLIVCIAAIPEDSIENDEIVGMYNNGDQFHLSFDPVRSMGVLLKLLAHFTIWFVLVIPITWNVVFTWFPMNIQDRLPRFPRLYARFLEALIHASASLMVNGRKLVELIIIHGILGFFGDCYTVVSWLYNQREDFRSNRHVITVSHYWQAFTRSIYGQLTVAIILSLLMRAVVFSDGPSNDQALLAPGAPHATHTIHSLPTKTAHAWFPASSTVPVKNGWDYLKDVEDEQTTPQTTRLLEKLLAPSRATKTSIPTLVSRSLPRTKLQRPVSSARAHSFDYADSSRAPHHHTRHHTDSEHKTVSHDSSAGVHLHIEERVQSPGPHGHTSLVVLGYHMEELEGRKLGHCDLCKQRHGFRVMIAERQLQFHLT